MLKPLSQNEIENVKATVARHQSVLAAGGQPDPIVVNSFVDSVVPRMLATIEAQQAEIKRVSDALADELLESVGVVNLDEDFNATDLVPEDLEQQEEGWQGL